VLRQQLVGAIRTGDEAKTDAIQAQIDAIQARIRSLRHWDAPAR
jgi:hypothetical protein